MIERYTKKTIINAIKILKAGNVIAFPTETVYGIGCLIDKPDAIKKMFELKKRENKPFQLIFPYKNMLKDYGHIRNLLELKIIKKIMPGKITLLLERNEKVGDNILQGSPYIGTRIPDNIIIQDILLQLDMPLVATSANIAGEKDLTSAQAVYEKFGKKIPLVIDGGSCESNIPSTVLKVENDEIVILRPGQFSKADILKKLEKK